MACSGGTRATIVTGDSYFAFLRYRGEVPGTLYLVASPIGNLQDITLRALSVLKEATVIACEDTRHTRHLLQHFGIGTPAVSYHDHNEEERAGQLIARLQAGDTVALVSDAGTPLVSDPGFRLVQAAVAAGLSVIPIPGACAAVTALAGSGLPTDSFYFGGFLPARGGQRKRALEEIGSLPSTLVFYEAPHRLVESLEDMAEVLGERDVSVCRELTKLHEEWIRGKLPDVVLGLKERDHVKGEVTIVVGKPVVRLAPERTIEQSFAIYLAEGMDRMEAMKAVARERGLSKREVYAALQKSG